MDHSIAVGIIQGSGDFPGDLECIFEGELLFAVEPRSQRFAFYIGRNVVQESVGRARIEQWKNVWMGESRGDADFLEESIGSDDRGYFWFEDFDGDEAVVLEIGGEVYRSHAAGTQLTLEPVPVRQSGFEPL